MQFFERQREHRRRTWQLLLLFSLVVCLLVVSMNLALATLWSVIFVRMPLPLYFFQVNTGVILLFVLGGWWVETSQLSLGGLALAKRVGARPVWIDSDGQGLESRFSRIVEELSIASGLPVPTACVIPGEDAINAFAAGWDQDDAIVAVTEGALRYLDRAELMGLVAHELSHIKEGDSRLHMRLSGMVYGLDMVHSFGASLTGRDEQGRLNAGVLAGWVIQGVGWLGCIAARTLSAAVMREREFLADARSVQFTRSKDGIGGVLRKVLGWTQAIHLASSLENRCHSTPVHAGLSHPSLSRMLLVSSDHQPLKRWLATHPPLEERIRRIYGRSMPPLELPTDRMRPAISAT